MLASLVSDPASMVFVIIPRLTRVLFAALQLALLHVSSFFQLFKTVALRVDDWKVHRRAMWVASWNDALHVFPVDVAIVAPIRITVVSDVILADDTSVSITAEHSWVPYSKNDDTYINISCDGHGGIVCKDHVTYHGNPNWGNYGDVYGKNVECIIPGGY
jgi:hypothetical protein